MHIRHTLDLNDAKRMAQATEELALDQGWRLSIAIVDAGGHTILLQRMDGATLASTKIAHKKACSALSYRTPTKNFEQGVTTGRTGLLALPDIIAFEGGLPVLIGDELVGAIGISGAQGQEDGVAAKAAIDCLQNGEPAPFKRP